MAAWRINMKKVLVSGIGGFVGSRIMCQLSDRFDLIAFPKGMLARANEKEVIQFIEKNHPDVIIHTAAVSDIGYSARHPEESHKANVLLPVWIAKGARETGAKLLAFSSDQVYSGINKEEPFDENAVLSPSNLYGCQKLESEGKVISVLQSAVMLRATWMYDFPGYGLPIRGNLLLNLLNAAMHTEELSFSEYDYRGITYVRQVVELLVPAMQLPGGVYNFGSENKLNMYDTAIDFKNALGLKLSLKKDEDSTFRNLAMSCEKIRKFGIDFDNTQDGIRRCVRDYGLSVFIPG